MADASHKGMGAKGDGSGAGANSADPADTDMLGEEDLAARTMGANGLHGEDQDRDHNERGEQADAKLRPDGGPVESAAMLDKDARAAAELGKGRGVHPGMKQGGVS